LVMSSTDEVICLNHHVCCHGKPETVSTDPAYLSLFGAGASNSLAVYTHHHTHEHDIHGDVIGECSHASATASTETDGTNKGEEK
jgi:zinc transport system ATP-binding protein